MSDRGYRHAKNVIREVGTPSFRWYFLQVVSSSRKIIGVGGTAFTVRHILCRWYYCIYTTGGGRYRGVSREKLRKVLSRARWYHIFHGQGCGRTLTCVCGLFLM